MDLKPGKWKLNFKGGKDKWLVVLAIGLIFLIMAFPAGNKSAGIGTGTSGGNQPAGDSAPENEAGRSLGEGAGMGQTSDRIQEAGNAVGNSQKTQGTSGPGSQPASSQSSSAVALSYEQQLEERLKELLSHVEGVGQVEVMIVLKSSEEKIWRVDRSTSYSSTQETDSNGGTRDIRSQEMTEGTILSGQTGEEGPLLEKEMRPEISGVVVTASGGGSPTIQAEISAAVEALFDVPSHKIKVLKRAE